MNLLQELLGGLTAGGTAYLQARQASQAQREQERIRQEQERARAADDAQRAQAVRQQLLLGVARDYPQAAPRLLQHALGLVPERAPLAPATVPRLGANLGALPEGPAKLPEFGGAPPDARVQRLAPFLGIERAPQVGRELDAGSSLEAVLRDLGPSAGELETRARQEQAARALAERRADQEADQQFTLQRDRGQQEAARELESLRSGGRLTLEAQKIAARERIAQNAVLARSGDAAAARRDTLLKVYLTGGLGIDEAWDLVERQEGPTAVPGLPPAPGPTPAPSPLLDKLFGGALRPVREQAGPTLLNRIVLPPAPLPSYTDTPQVQSPEPEVPARAPVGPLPAVAAELERKRAAVNLSEARTATVAPLAQSLIESRAAATEARKAALLLRAELGRGGLDLQRTKAQATAAVQQARLALSQYTAEQKRAAASTRLPPAVDARVRYVGGRIQRLEQQINMLQRAGSHADAARLVPHLETLVADMDSLLDSGAAAARGSGPPVLPLPAATGASPAAGSSGGFSPALRSERLRAIRKYQATHGTYPDAGRINILSRIVERYGRWPY